jgi:hypothetical protein
VKRAHRSPVRRTGPSPAVVELVWERDSGRCAACAGLCTGERGFDWSLHHRMARRAGGTRRPFINLPGNLVLLHGHGSALCHGDVERFRVTSESKGLVIRDGQWLPSQIPIEHAVHGRVLLDDSGGWTPAPGSLPERAS